MRRLFWLVACLACAAAAAGEEIRLAGQRHAPDIESLVLEIDAGAAPPDFSVLRHFTQLRAIDLRGAGITDMSTLPLLPQVQVLEILGTEIKDLSALARLPNLRVLHIRGEQQTGEEDMPTAARWQLCAQEKAVWANYRGIADISVLAQLAHLRELRVEGTDIADLDALRGLQQLETLELIGNWKIRRIPAPNQWRGLRHFAAVDTRIESFAGLQYADNLESLALNEVGELKDVDWLAPLQKLETLNLRDTHIKNPDGLRHLQNLRTLEYTSWWGNPELSALQYLHNLQELTLHMAAKTGLAPLAQLQNLVRLHIPHSGHALDIAPLRHLHRLEVLQIKRSPSVVNIAPLRHLKNLRRLSLDETGVADIGALQELPRLEYLSIEKTAVTDRSALQAAVEAGRLRIVSDISE